MKTVDDVKDMRYTTEAGDSIDCMVKFSDISDYVPFGATPYDPEDYGRQIYTDCRNGVYGPVAPYTPPGIPVVEIN